MKKEYCIVCKKELEAARLDINGRKIHWWCISTFHLRRWQKEKAEGK